MSKSTPPKSNTYLIYTAFTVIALAVIAILLIVSSTHQSNEPKRWDVVTDGYSYGYVSYTGSVESGFKTKQDATHAMWERRNWSDSFDAKIAGERDLSKWKTIPSLPEDNVSVGWFWGTNSVLTIVTITNR